MAVGKREVGVKKVLIGILALFGVLSILGVIAIAGITVVALIARPGVPGQVVLEVNFEGGVVEAVPEDPLAEYLYGRQLQLRDVVDALDRAAGDRRVKAFVARIGGSGMGLAHIQEVRDAVMRFRKSGKPAIAFAETFGEFGPGNGGYYLATAFDGIYLQPSGDIGLTGLILETTFVRGALDKLDIEPRMDHRKEYKNAMNFYTETGFTDAHREGLQSMLDSWFGQIVRGIAEARNLGEDEVRALVDRGPFLGQEALDAGLVDGLAYRDEVFDGARDEAGSRARLLYVGSYLDRAGRPHDSGTTVALIHGNGAVVRGRSQFSPITGETAMGADSVTSAFRAAIKDRRVKAILFRVDSPGGSYVASDTIRREVLRAKEAGKPVVVSMSNVAGSGGYFVAMDADRIVAQPGTITGSIGVLGGKMVTSGFWNKLGVTSDEVHAGANATQWTGSQDYTPAEYARFQASLDRIYDDFTRKVAEGRGLPLERVLEIAKGRIWSGEQALELGPVDAVGGLDVALAHCRELLDLDADASIRLRRFPREMTALEMLFAEEPDSSERTTSAALRESLELLRPHLRRLHRAGLLGPRPGVLMTPEVGVPQ